MTTVDMPREQFRLSMLLYDTRYRSLTIQAFAVIAFMAFAAWLVNNTVENLNALGKDFSFGFLGARAGYDISQSLIPYSNDSTPLRAAGRHRQHAARRLRGLHPRDGDRRRHGRAPGSRTTGSSPGSRRSTSTASATSRSCSILAWRSSPTWPRRRRRCGDSTTTPTSMLFGSIAVTNRGLYVPWPVFGPGWHIVVGTFIASLIAIMLFGRWAARRQEETGEILPTFWIKLAIFFLPVLIVDRLMGGPISLDYPVLQRFNFQGGGFLDKSFIALTLALALYTGAFIAERARRHPGGLAGPDRGGERARAQVEPGDEPRGASAGAPGHHPAADLAVPQPHQELVAGSRVRLCRRTRHPRRHHHEPDRARARVHAAAHGLLPGAQPADLVGDELVQRPRRPEERWR